MTRKISLTLGVICCVGFFAFSVAQAQDAVESIDKPAATDVDGKISWLFDYVEAQKASRTSGKPMFVVFRCER